MTNNRKQILLEKLAIRSQASKKVVGEVLRHPKDAVAYLTSKVPGRGKIPGTDPMAWSTMLKRTKDSTGTAMYRPDLNKTYQAFPIVGGREAKRLKTVVN